ncbi:MAG: LPS export ABC transporter permease LptG [Alphaproteobacteria bacterium]|nr:LPS export ABC transporter permease LptG [Alphaproteobacteria bacterium]
MLTIGVYVSRLFLGRFLLCALGFTAVIQILELLEVTRDLAVRGDGGFLVTLYYMGLRFPAILVQTVPLAVLMGALLALLHLAANNEIIALKSVGISFYAVLASLLPVGLLVALGYHVLGDLVAPAADRKLQFWWNETTPLAQQSLPPRAWMRDGDSVVVVDRIHPRGDELYGVTIHVRDAAANMTERLVAEQARYEDGQWRLYSVHRQLVNEAPGAQREEIPMLPWASGLTPANLAEIATPPRIFTFTQLRRVLSGEWVGSRAQYYYQTKLHKKIAGPVSLLLLILIAAPVAQTIRREGTGGLALVFGVILGFGYFVADGLVLTLGEGGLLPGIVAAWMPTLIFTMVSGAILLHREH